MLLLTLIGLYWFSCCKLDFLRAASFGFVGIHLGNELKEVCEGGLRC